MKKLLTIILIASCAICQGQEVNHSKISGVVTYYFNENYGDKPDLGANVFLIPCKNLPAFNYRLVDTLIRASKWRYINSSYKELKIPLDETSLKSIKKFRADDESYFNYIDSVASENVLELQLNNNVKKAVVDGAGNYSIRTNPGTYYLLIQSNNRKCNSMTEINGQIFCKKIKLISGSDENISANFIIR